MKAGLQLDKSGKLRLSETDIQRTASDLLIADGWRLLRTDPVSNKLLGKGFGEIGMADCLFIRYETILARVAPKRGGKLVEIADASAEVLWCEFKSAKGRPTPAQLFWHERERARGALTWIAGTDFEASIEGFTRHYKASGLQRRKLSA